MRSDLHSSTHGAFLKLREAASSGRAESYCLRLWSNFIRIRDDNRCVECHTNIGLSAHHICRKSLLPEARYQTGNGITLCRRCHCEVHEGFNGRPDLSMPMDAQGGEKIERMERLFCILHGDADDRKTLNDDYYFLSDQVLAKFKLLQGFAWNRAFPGSRLEQACSIWSACPQNLLQAQIKALFSE